MTSTDTLSRSATRPVSEIRDDVANTKAALGHLRRLQETMTGRKQFEYGCVVRDAEERLAEFRSELAKAEVGR